MKKLLLSFMMTVLCFSMVGGVFAESKSQSNYMDMHSYSTIYKMSEDADIKLPFIKSFTEKAIYDKMVGSSGLSISPKNIEIQNEMKGVQTIISGDTVNITGKLEYANIIANNVIIDGEISKDVLIVAGSVFVTEKAKIGGDFVCMAQTVVLKGILAGNVILSSEEAVVSSNIEKDFRASAENLEISASTAIKGKIYIETNSALNILDKYPDAIVQKYINTESKITKQINLKEVAMSGVLAVLSYMVLYYIIRRMNKNATVKYSTKVKSNPTFTILMGFASIFLIPAEIIIILIACAYGLGAVLGPILIVYIALVIAILFLSTFITGVIIFESILPNLINTKEDTKNSIWLEALILISIFAVLYILTKVPITSGYATAFVTLVALGSVVTNIFKKDKTEVEVKEHEQK